MTFKEKYKRVDFAGEPQENQQENPKQGMV